MATQNIEIRVIDKTSRALSSISAKITAINTGLLGVNRIAGAAALAIGAIGGANLIRRIVAVSSEFQDLRTTLTSVTGSAQAGADAFGFLTNLSTETQFSVQDLTTTFIKLSTAGINPTKDLLLTFTDAAAVTTDQLGTLQAITDLFARTTQGGLGLEEINRLTDRGLPALDILAEKLGLNRQQISEFGKSAEGARIITEALAEGIQERFGGATAARLNNLSVQFSNLNIAIDNAADKVGRGGLNAALGDLTTRLTETINTNEQLATDLGRKLGTALLIAGDAAAFVARNIDTLALAALGFIGLKVTLSVLSLATALASGLFTALGVAIKGMTLLTSAARKSKIALAGLLGPISLIAYGLTELALTSDFVKEKIGGVADETDDYTDKLGDNATILEKINNLTKDYVGIDVGGYIQSVKDRQNELAKAQEDLNKKQDEYNQNVASGNQLDTNAIENLKAKKKTFEEVLVSLQNEIDQNTIAIEQDQIKAGLLRAEIETGKQLNDLQKKELTALLNKNEALKDQATLQGIIKEKTDAAIKATYVGLIEQQELLRKTKEMSIEKVNAEVENEVEKFAIISQLEEQYLIDSARLDEQYLNAKNDRRLTLIKAALDKEIKLQQEAGKQIMATRMAAGSKQFLQEQGQDERRQQIIRDRIEFEKKSELEKTQFGLEQATTLFTGLSKVNKKFFAAQKAAAIALAIVNTYQGATKALATYPPPFNFIAAAATVASGLAQVATIRAQTMQRGGTLIGGSAAVVGEDGPELIVPKQSSTVIPREVADAVEGLGGGRSQPVVVNFNISTVDAEGFDELLIRRRATITGIINTALEKRGKVGVTG